MQKNYRKTKRLQLCNLQQQLTAIKIVSFHFLVWWWTLGADNMSKVAVVFGGAVISLLIAIFAARHSLFVHHFLNLVSFGKYIPGIKTLGISCDSVPIQDPTKSYRDNKYLKCFDIDENNVKSVRIVDVGHNETLMKIVLLDALEKRCPVIVRHPFRDHKCYDRLRELATSDIPVRVKENTPDTFSNNDTWFPVE